MEKVYKFKIHCATESEWKDVLLESDETPPTKCPNDTSHSVTLDSAYVDSVLDKGHIKTEQIIPAGGSGNIFDGFQFVATKDSTTVHEYKIANDFYLHLGELEAMDSGFKDSIDMEIVDVDGILYPEGTILKRYINNYPIDSTGKTLFHTNKKTSVNLKNLYMRLNYHSTGTENDVCAKIRLRGFDS